MNALIKHIEDINAETKAWVEEDPNNRWAGMLTTDLDHWNEMGIFTVEDFQRDELINQIRECSKTAYGHKINLDWDSYTMEDLEDMAKSYSQAASDQLEAEAVMEKEASQKFEATIHELQTTGNVDRKTAIRWLLEAEEMDEYDLAYGGSYACYNLNLPYSYEKEFTEVMKNMNPVSKEAA